MVKAGYGPSFRPTLQSYAWNSMRISKGWKFAMAEGGFECRAASYKQRN
jgi:hypothetical protein